jgi:hypothetical protein
MDEPTKSKHESQNQFFFFDGIESYNKFEDENEKYRRSYKEKFTPSSTTSH